MIVIFALFSVVKLKHFCVTSILTNTTFFNPSYIKIKIQYTWKFFLERVTEMSQGKLSKYNQFVRHNACVYAVNMSRIKVVTKVVIR